MSDFINKILKENKKFVEDEKYKNFLTTKYPDKKTVIISCMDTRLTELLPAALNFKNGDVKIIKNAGGADPQFRKCAGSWHVCFCGRRDVRPLVFWRGGERNPADCPRNSLWDFQLGRGVKDFRRGGGLCGTAGSLRRGGLWIEGHGITAAGLGL